MSVLATQYLEMHSPDRLQAVAVPEGLLILEAEIKQYQFNRFLYQLIGGAWQWTDRMRWTEQRWRELVEADNYRTWVAYCQGAPAGYFELHRQARGDVEIAYFGLSPPFIGQGIGGPLLSTAIDCAWQWSGTRRVWVHTCTDDHPAALPNYQARGLVLYRTETKERSDDA